jgi:hypothetical protein
MNERSIFDFGDSSVYLGSEHEVGIGEVVGLRMKNDSQDIRLRFTSREARLLAYALLTEAEQADERDEGRR